MEEELYIKYKFKRKLKLRTLVLEKAEKPAHTGFFTSSELVEESV
jgi:hypothetical protein